MAYNNTIMRQQTLRFFLVLLALIAVPAVAQTTVEVIPPAPTSADFVTLRVFDSFLGFETIDVQRTGNHFRIEIDRECPILCFVDPSLDVDLQTLPAGTYTYEIILDGSPAASGGFVVAQAELPDAPALSPAALIALCLILAGAGWIFIGRQT